MLDKGFGSSVSLDQPGKIMVGIERPMTACRFIEIGTEGVFDGDWIKRVDPIATRVAWRKVFDILTPEIPELAGIRVIDLCDFVMTEKFSQPTDAPILIAIL